MKSSTTLGSEQKIKNTITINTQSHLIKKTNQPLESETENSEHLDNIKTNFPMNKPTEILLELYKKVNSLLFTSMEKDSLRKFIMSPLSKGQIMFTNINILSNSYNEMELNCAINGNDFILLTASIKKMFNYTNCAKIFIGGSKSEKIGKIVSNYLRNDFTFYSSPKETRQLLGNIRYNINPFGIKGPRKFTVLLPRLIDEEHVIYTNKIEGNAKFMDIYKNTDPVWSKEYREYKLDFNERVKLKSKKNFIMLDSMNDNEKIIQFGIIDKDTYALDFQFPISVFQAFCIGITSIIDKVSCE